MSRGLTKALAEVDSIIAKWHKFKTIPSPRLSSGPQARYRAKVPTATAQPTTSQSSPPKASSSTAPGTESSSGPAAKQQPDGPSRADTFMKAKLVVGLITKAEALENSDKLYRCQVQVGPGAEDTVQILAGLRAFISQPELENRKVAVIVNLKGKKLAGEPSNGMILAASKKGEDGESKELVKPLSVPDVANPGDLIYQEGREPMTEFPKEFKQWSKSVPFLAVKDSKATFDGTVLETASGSVTVDSSIPDGGSIS